MIKKHKKLTEKVQIHLFSAIKKCKTLKFIAMECLMFPQTSCSTVLNGIRYWAKTQKSLVHVPWWSTDVVYCAHRQDTLIILSQSKQLQLGTGLHWELTWDWLLYQPVGVNNFHRPSLRETGDKHQYYSYEWL